MSINITVHGNPVNQRLKRNYFIDEEHFKKQLFEERRKLRLGQVRQKSKELASQVRQNVNLEAKRQLEKIEQIKADELRKWRAKCLQKSNDEYEKNLQSLGDAHKAAVLETIQENTLKNVNEHKINTNIVINGRRNAGIKKSNEKTKSIQQKNLREKSRGKKPKAKNCYHDIEVNNENSSHIANIQNSCTARESKHLTPIYHVDGNLSLTENTRTSEESDSGDNSSIDNKQNKETYATYKTKTILSKTPSIVLSIDSESDSSVIDIEDKHEEINTHYSRISSRRSIDSNQNTNLKNPLSTTSSGPTTTIETKSQSSSSNAHGKGVKIPPTTLSLLKNSDVQTMTSTRQFYNPKDYKSTDTSSEVSDILENRKKRYTQISELIKKRQGTQEISPSKNNNITNFSTELNEDINDCQDSTTLKSNSNISEQKSIKADDKLKSTKTVQIDQAPKKHFSKDNVNTQFNKPSSLKSSTKTSSKSFTTTNQSNRVQFYDYNNKFEKQYNQPDAIVIRNNEEPDQLNATEQAKVESLLKEAHQRNLDELRKRSDERSQKALEREQVKRDYDELTAKLEVLNKERNFNRTIREDVNSYSENRIRQIAEERQKKMNTAIEGVLERPVMITCPEIRNITKLPTQTDQLNSTEVKSTLDINVATYEQLKRNENEVNLNSSDSCASILLNYVDHQSKQINDDIGNCKNNDKIQNLQILLKKINNLRTQLLSELQKCEQPFTNGGFENVVTSISSLRKEREEILSRENDYQKTKADLEKREQKLKRKEELVEKKIRELYQSKKKKSENQQKLENKIPSSTATDNEDDLVILSEKSKANKPVKIIIKLNDEIIKRAIKSPYKSPRKRSSLIDAKPKRKKRISQGVSKIDLEPKCISPTKHTISIHENTSSTSYRSPPNRIQTRFGQLLDLHVTKSEKIRPAASENIIPKGKDHPVPLKKKRVNALLSHYIERLLGMSRSSIEMLGVSSSEVETPSTSVINTSKNISVSSEADLMENQERIARLQKFIDDNYNFLTEVDKSLSTSTDSSIKTIENIWMKTLKNQEQKMKEEQRQKYVRPILKKRKESIRKQQSSPILPLSRLSKENLTIELSQDESKISSQHDGDKLELVNKYTELTENCTQRIAELTEMINKVRQEKQRILEITLSSGTETGRNSTEYMDFAEKHHQPGSSNNSSKISDPKILASIEETSDKVQLEKNKLTGMSRDSGISLSRPLTALDTRESPDIRILDKQIPMPMTVRQPELSEQQSVFEPILKDIPKIPTQLAPNAMPKTLPSDLDVLTTDNTIDRNRRDKPPVSMARYSPQLVEEIPHELSTILEVETPATSRINTSVNDNRQEVFYKKFPTFEEYAQQHNLDLTKFDPETSAKINVDFQELLGLSEQGNINGLKYKEFPSLHTYLMKHNEQVNDLTSSSSTISQENLQELINSLKLINIDFKTFPTRKEYADKVGVSGLLDTQSINEVEVEGSGSENENKDTNSKSSPTESLLDVVAELKRRNILKHSFRNEGGGQLLDDDAVISKSTSDKSDDLTTSKTPIHIDQINDNKPKSLKSPKKQSQTISKLQFKAPINNSDDQATRNSTETPAKAKFMNQNNETQKENIQSTGKSENSTITGIEVLQNSSNQSSIDGIEKDLDRMGLKWASLMLRKSQNMQELNSSTTSSGFVYKTPRKKISPKKLVDKSFNETTGKLDEIKHICSETSNNTSTSSIDIGKPLNLRDFLAKELQKRTNTSTSLSSSDDSLASQFLRSLLGSTAMNVTPKRCGSDDKPVSSGDGAGAGGNDRQRTSTPVLTRSTISSPKQQSQNHDNSSKLFSAESRLSSIKISSHGSRSTSDSTYIGYQQNRQQKQESAGSTSDDILIAPDRRLDSNSSSIKKT